MSLIETVWAREILDSRGNPTVEAEVYLEYGTKSVGRQFRRAHQRAKTKRLNCVTAINHAIWAKERLKAVENVNEKIAYELEGMDALDQTLIDQTMIELDGTENKSNLGRKCDFGSFAGVRSGGRSRFSKCRFIAIWRHKCENFTCSDDEHFQWWRTRRQQCGFSRIYGLARWRRKFSEGLRCGAEIFHN